MGNENDMIKLKEMYADSVFIKSGIYRRKKNKG